VPLAYSSAVRSTDHERGQQDTLVMESDDVFESEASEIYEIRTRADGPAGSLPISEEMLLNHPSGDLFGLSQNAGMGWTPADAGAPQFLILSTQGGVRAADGSPIALGYHTGHWEIGLLVQEAAAELRRLGKIPFAGYCSDPCDGRTQGTTGMFDSLPYRNDAAMVFRRLARSLPRRRGVLGIATCDKGLPAMMMAIAGLPDLAGAIVPGGVTLPPAAGEDAGTVQTLGTRFAHGQVSLADAAELGCRACATPGGGCQFLGTAATAQVVSEALGLSLPHSALAPSGQPVWLDLARRTARALTGLEARGIAIRDVLTPGSIRNAMLVHAAFGGSTNLLLHIPAIAHAARLRVPTVDDWIAASRKAPRLVSVLPNGPVHHPTVRVFLAGGVPEVMLPLRAMGLLDLDVLTVTGRTLGENLEWWESSDRRRRFRVLLREHDGVDPDDVILPPDRARAKGMTATTVCPRGNLAPDGAVVKATAIDRTVVDANGVYHKVGRARVFVSETDAMAAIKQGRIQAGDVLVLTGVGPMGTGMEETYQVTGALKQLAIGREVALLTDARFSGVSTGACIGHIGPEGLAGGPIGKVRDSDLIEIYIDCRRIEGRIDLIGDASRQFTREEGARVLAERPLRDDLAANPDLPDDTRLWAALQAAAGGTWAGCVYDPDRIAAALAAGRRALTERATPEAH
jgi:putative YjhG/YagF family dehydratase